MKGLGARGQGSGDWLSEYYSWNSWLKTICTGSLAWQPEHALTPQPPLPRKRGRGGASVSTDALRKNHGMKAHRMGAGLG